MPDLIIFDTSCLILFDKINKLDLLKRCYTTIFVTPEVASEWDNTLPEWIVVRKVKNQLHQRILEQLIGAGESSAIALGLEVSHSIVVIDDLKARKLAKSLNLRITGSLSILVKAKQKGYVARLTPILDDIQQTDFRISEKILKRILNLAGE
jgi:predicted nucleic acid-binding protein